jgi:hypothetical protein
MLTDPERSKRTISRKTLEIVHFEERSESLAEHLTT